LLAERERELGAFTRGCRRRVCLDDAKPNRVRSDVDGSEARHGR
jgi:hypothetical protein